MVKLVGNSFLSLYDKERKHLLWIWGTTSYDSQWARREEHLMGVKSWRIIV